MIEVQDKSQPTDVFEDAVHATAFIATVHVREGELMLPQRIREHIADGPVVVHLMRGQDDVAVHPATLTSRSTLTGIEWPDDVQPRMTLTVMCPRGAASHDVGVLLPNLPDEAPFVDPEDVEAPDIHGELLESEPFAEPEPWCDEHGHPALRCTYCDTTGEIDETGTAARLRAVLAATDQIPAAETALPGPAEYEVPTDLPATGELELPTWPADEDLAAGETTETLTAVLVPAVPDFDEAEPGTVFSAALVAVRTPPRRAGWLERRIRLAARWVLDRSWTATRVVMASASGLVLVGFGLAYVVMAVTR